MKLTQEVFFTTFTDLMYTNYVHGDFDTHLSPRKMLTESIESIQNFCKRICQELQDTYYIDKKTHEMLVSRTVRIRDIDDKKYHQSHNFNGGGFKFILSTNGKLIYPSDILSALNVPHYFKGTESHISKTKKDVPVYIEEYNKYNAKFRSLTAEDTVVDKNLNQIWPVATHKPPIALVELLKKTTEKVW